MPGHAAELRACADLQRGGVHVGVGPAQHSRKLKDADPLGHPCCGEELGIAVELDTGENRRGLTGTGGWQLGQNLQIFTSSGWSDIYDNDTNKCV